jgi:hypothetical protein
VDKKALVHLDEISLSWEELKELPNDHLAAIAVLSYAVSETNALSRIYLCQSHEYLGEKAIDSASNVHRFMIIRSWSSRLFEIEQFLRFGGKKPETSDELLKELADAALERLKEISVGEGFEVARDIRNEATNHYSFKAAKKNLSSVHNSADCKMYLHRQNGNCFYPFGEEVMFHARLNRRWKQISTKQERDRLFGQWLDWNIAANRWLAETHANFTNSLVFKPLDRNEARKRVYWVPIEFVGNYSERLTPIFFESPESK